MNMLFSITFLQFDTLFYLCFNLSMREFNLKNNIRACVKENKNFQSDETQSKRRNLKGSIFYGKSIERNVERVCKQPPFYQHDGDHE
mgnify:CR=1 FL=1